MKKQADIIEGFIDEVEAEAIVMTEAEYGVLFGKLFDRDEIERYVMETLWEQRQSIISRATERIRAEMDKLKEQEEEREHDEEFRTSKLEFGWS